jgi:hypothetical protein
MAIIDKSTPLGVSAEANLDGVNETEAPQDGFTDAVQEDAPQAESSSGEAKEETGS